MEFDEKFIKRFWSHVDIKSENECWEWQKCRSKDGYGYIMYTTSNIKKPLKTHRVAYELTYGSIPDNLEVRHFICDNPGCCNPFHLLLGTQTENIKDMDDRGRRGSAKGEKNGRAILTEKDVLDIRDFYSQKDISTNELAKIYLVSISTIAHIVTGLSWKNVGGKINIYEDTRYTCSIVTKEQVREIRELYRDKQYSSDQLCEIYGIKTSTLYAILTYRRWKDVQ
jgi:transposase